ncbi:hypothetical protein AX16_007567 [Volvariella volvacea WC 439]|nr:hypothetical protein AX16_007567 [Volvariella volvacea WC 439]
MGELPTELLYKIAGLIDNGLDCLPLRLVSRRYDAVFTSFVIRYVTIRVVGGHVQTSTRSSDNTPMREHPSQPIPRAFIRHVPSLLLDITFPQHSSADPTLLDELSRFTGLKNLRVSCISPSGQSPPLLHNSLQTVIDAAYGGLTSLQIELHGFCALPNALIKLRCLETPDPTSDGD